MIAIVFPNIVYGFILRTLDFLKETQAAVVYEQNLKNIFRININIFAATANRTQICLPCLYLFHMVSLFLWLYAHHVDVMGHMEDNGKSVCMLVGVEYLMISEMIWSQAFF
ncbi:hypothetical protein ACJX0J_030771, partial [Zea mays]